MRNAASGGGLEGQSGQTVRKYKIVFLGEQSGKNPLRDHFI